MKKLLFAAFALASLAPACVFHEQAEVRQQIVSVDAREREFLFAPLRALEGRWQGQDASGTALAVEFHVSSGGSAVREVMLPGAEHEMTNMYTLDGNRLRMTHYCSEGNQPHMLGSVPQEGRIDFASEVVSDLKAADALYMGRLTLVFVDADHIEEHWTALRGDKVDHESVFKLARVK